MHLSTAPSVSSNTQASKHALSSISWVHVLFFFSGFPALIYQIVWQRALFALYGINIQSVTIVVSAFMLGLGLGSLAGGTLSGNKRLSMLTLFAAAELATATFGLMSLRLFHRVADFTASRSLFVTGVVSFLLVLVPTLLMGATLPLLVEYLVLSRRNVGDSVGGLYFANTLGSGFACFLAAGWLMQRLGQSGSVRFAATINALVAAGALLYSRRHRQRYENRLPNLLPNAPRLPSSLSFPFAFGCAAFSGFAALSYEIIWYRVLAFASGDTAPVFACLLGAYLFGVALGSRFVERDARDHEKRVTVHGLGVALVLSSILAFAVIPLATLEFTLVNLNSRSPGYQIMLLLVCLAAAFFGATFPLIAHTSISPTDKAGAQVSYLYAANILGSTLGTLVSGFFLLDHFSIFQISSSLLFGGVLTAIVVFRRSGKPASWIFAPVGVAVLVALASRPISRTMYDRLLFKNRYPDRHFEQVIENRSGVIGVTPNGTVFGGGVYDGRFNTDLMQEVNGVIRPFGISAVHQSPRRMLMIGIGSGSWGQVLANHPQLSELIIVEINPGYLQIIRDHPGVASLLTNPKVKIAVDDGRRWLVHHAEEKFDVIVMNTSFHWRNHSSNLLSAEFLRLVRPHLKTGGVLFYNTTGSEDVMATALSVYPYGIRFANCMAVGDSPIILDRIRWRNVLLQYSIDGARVIDASDPGQLKKLEEVVNIPEDLTGREATSIEENDNLRIRLQHRLIITDDNMGVEWH